MRLRSKMLALIISMLLTVNMLPAAAFAAPADITGEITDANLLQAIRTKLNKPSGSITDADMLTIIDLNAYNRSITSLAGLEYAENLEELFANGNSISDLTPLAGLTNMKRLYLWSNNISNIAPLSGLTGLMNLDLNSNHISDISALSGMANLEALSLFQNSITNISNLSGLDSLADLELDNNTGITDYSPLSGLTGLHTLSLSGNGISSISALSGLTGLTWLNLDGNNISDISILHSMTHMQRLSLANNHVQDISALSGMTQLWELIIGANQVQDISPLAGLISLTTLDLYHNNISNISSLAGLTNLETLYLNENAIQNISPLKNMTHLTGLSIRNNNISDISVLGPLTQSTNLAFLYLRNNYLNLTEGSDTRNIINAIVAKVPDAARWNEQNALSGTPFNAQAVAQSAGSVALSWDHLPDTTYEVSRSTGAGPSVDIPLPNDTDTSYTDTGLASGTGYTYTIKALIWQGSGASPVTLQKSVTASTNSAPVTGITVSGTGGVSAITTDGGTLQMLAAISPANATDPSVTWSIISGADFADLSTSGLLTAKQNGTVTVRATANDGSGIYGEAVITIAVPPQNVPVTGITVSGTDGVSTITAAGGTLQMLAAVTPANATDASVNWSIISGADFADLSASGLMTAKQNGTVTVRATANDGSGIYGEAVITIAVPTQPVPVTGITVSGADGVSTITAAGGTLQMLAAVTPASATDPSVNWSIISGADFADLSVSGLMTAKQNGTVTVRAAANDGSGIYGETGITIAVPAQPIPVTGITVSGADGVSTITAAGGTLQMLVAVTPANATVPLVNWSIASGVDYAQISQSGLLTAKQNGTVTVRAAANDGSGIYGETDITIAVPMVHPVMSGAGGIYHQQGLSGLTFRIDCDFDSFQGLTVDGNTVDPDDYDARPGSTVITLHENYLDIMPLGEHAIRALFTDGYAQASFTVAQELEPHMPATGDNSEPELFGIIGLLSLSALALQAMLKRKRATR